MSGLIIRLTLSFRQEPGLNFGSKNVRMRQEAFRSISLSLLTLGLLLLGRHLQVGNRTSTHLSACLLAGMPRPPLLWRAIMDAWEPICRAPVQLGCHTGRSETTQRPRLSSSTAPSLAHYFPWTSTEAFSLPPLPLWPLPFLHTQQPGWAFKNIILLALFPLLCLSVTSCCA